MPIITFQGHTITCEPGANLRRLLLDHDLPPYNGKAVFINCRGLGTCGTCAVQIEGEVSPPAARERVRLALPPHRAEAGLRLACQCQVLGDLQVIKHPGFWGQRVQSADHTGQGEA